MGDTEASISDTDRPRWSAAAAARHCGVSRSTIMRALAAGKIAGAVQTPEGWSIPLDGLLAAGFTPDRPAPPDPDRDHVRTLDDQVRAADHLASRVADLEAKLHDAEREADRQRSRAAVAEAVANERAGHITDLQRVVAALEVGRSEAQAPAPPAAPTPAPAPTPSPRRRLFSRLRT